MGAFGYGILDSDDSMDFESEISEACGYDYENEEHKEEDFVNKQNLERVRVELHKKWSESDDHFGRKNIAYQVLAAYLVSEGATFDSEVLEACKNALNSESDYCFERKYHTNYLLNVLENYDNTPTDYYDKTVTVSNAKNDLEVVNHIISIVEKELSKFDIVKKIKPCALDYSYGIVVLLDDTVQEKVDKIVNEIQPSYFGVTIVFIVTSDFN